LLTSFLCSTFQCHLDTKIYLFYEKNNFFFAKLFIFTIHYYCEGNKGECQQVCKKKNSFAEFFVINNFILNKMCDILSQLNDAINIKRFFIGYWMFFI
jgi:hypothetical protein